MSIHGYNHNNEPMFTNVTEYVGYLDVKKEQEIANRGKFEWADEIRYLNRKIEEVFKDISFGLSLKEGTPILKSLKDEFDIIYEMFDKAPIKRLCNTDIIDEYTKKVGFDEKLKNSPLSTM